MAPRKVPRPFRYEWGGGQVVEEVSFVGEWSEPALQLLRYEGGDNDGDEVVRFCFYNLRGAWQRHPLALGADDMKKFRALLKKDAPRMRAMLKQLVAD